MSDPRYNSDLGIYTEGCGLDNLDFAYGHDEYLYRMLIANGTQIPPEGLAMVRYHSAYPWHTGGAYRQFMNDHVLKILSTSKLRDIHSINQVYTFRMPKCSSGFLSLTNLTYTRRTIKVWANLSRCFGSITRQLLKSICQEN